MKLANLVHCFCLVILLACGLKCEEEYCDAADASCNIDHIQEKVRNKMIVAAIDFGTTYSGWAYQTKHQYRKDPTVIETSKWTHSDILSKKTPTTVLIKPDGLTLEAFGYEAEKRYLTLAEKEEHEKYFYFKRFKMMLYDKKNLNTETKLVDDKGLELPAITVFSLAIGFLKNHLMDDLKKMDQAWTMDDIHWVLTVPAIWNDMAKQFMRKSAVAAGILTEDLTIALEPEAASLYCRLLPVEKQVDDTGAAFLNSFQPGRKYMVLDAGGGTLDVTVHELLTKLYLRELYKATGGPWGGVEVDRAFEHVLATLFGKDMYDIVKRKCSYDYLDILRGFERIKRSISPGSDSEHVVRMPLCFHQLVEKETGAKLADKIAGSIYKDDIRTRLDRIVLSAKLSQSFFKEVIHNIIEHVKQLLAKPELEGIDSLLLVGGFAESKMLQQAMQSNFADYKERPIKVFTPNGPELAIVKGAVLFGFQPRNVEERIAPYTYGVKTVRSFMKNVHDEIKCKKFLQKGVYKCDNLFAKFVEIGMPIRYGEVQGEREFKPLSEDTRNVGIFIYACTERFPEYVTDKGCEKRAKVTLELLEHNIPLDERIITVNFMFSDSENTVTAREKHSGNRVEVTLDFDAE